MINSRISNGEKAQPGQFPFHVALFYQLRYRCGAALVSQKATITAAHCVVNLTQHVLPKENFNLLFGSVDLESLNGNEALRNVSEVIRHPEYDIDKILMQDIAIVIIQGLLQFSQHISPICLPDTLNATVNIDSSIILGFGSTTQSLETSRYLNFGEMSVISRQQCTENIIFALLPEQSTFCAISSTNNTAACPGNKLFPSYYEWFKYQFRRRFWRWIHKHHQRNVLSKRNCFSHSY